MKKELSYILGKKKIPKAIWRGGSSGGWGFAFNPRLELVKVASQFPHYIDAKFSSIFPCQSYEELAPYLGPSISVKEHLKYKYQLLPDGHVSAFSRAYWELFSNCIIFKQDSPWYQWYYRALKPYEHFIPYKDDASDLVEKLRWAENNDAAVKEIVNNAQSFAKNNLKHEDVMLYFYLLLNEYAKLQQP